MSTTEFSLESFAPDLNDLSRLAYDAKIEAGRAYLIHEPEMPRAVKARIDSRGSRHVSVAQTVISRGAK